MEEKESYSLKIRFKLPSGEEFEAEGPKEFIEEQRAYFLTLTGKQPSTQKINPGGNYLPLSTFRPSSQYTTRPTYPLTAPQQPKAAQPAQHITSEPAEQRLPGAEVSPIWEKLFKTEDGALVLRRKSRLLTPQTAALVLIAAARILRKENEYSALHLSKSLRKSGYGEGRLDRLLLAEIRAGSLQSVGSKRGRAYKLSGEGFARAIVLAEKMAEDL